MTQVLPAEGSSAAASVCAFVDVSRSLSAAPTGFAPGGGVAAGDPPSTASSTEPAAPRNHRLIRSRVVLTFPSNSTPYPTPGILTAERSTKGA